MGAILRECNPTVTVCVSFYTSVMLVVCRFLFSKVYPFPLLYLFLFPFNAIVFFFNFLYSLEAKLLYKYIYLSIRLYVHLSVTFRET